MPRAFTDKERSRIRTRLRAVARTALVSATFRRLTVDTLAREAGISKGAFYLFYDTKEALLMELMQEAEAEIREALRKAAGQGLRQVITEMFDGVARNPLLQALGNPDELAWLERALPDGVLAAARADDDAFAGELLSRLYASGDIQALVDPSVFAGIGPAALALAQHKALIGEDRYDDVKALIVEGLTLRLRNG